MTTGAHDFGASLGEWNALVRRARMVDRQKLAALTVSSYADPDGTGIRLTPPRLAVDMGVSYSTARRYLTWLREVGLLEMTHAGNRRLNTASEYRLILGPDVMEHLQVLSPTEVRARMDGMREAEREGTRVRVAKLKASDQRSSKVSVNEPDQRSARVSVNEPSETLEPAESPGDQRSARVSVKDGINAQTEVDQRSPLDEQHTFPTTPTRVDQPSRADDEDLGTAVTGPRAKPDRTPTPTPTRCPTHDIPLKPRADGQQACGFCRREARAGGKPDPEPPSPSGPPRCRHQIAADRCRTCLAEQRIAPVIDLSTRRTA